MANLKASKKDVRHSATRRKQNSAQRARLRSLDKKIRQLLDDDEMEKAREVFRECSSYLDRAGKRHLIHPRQANRRKSRMAALINRTASAV